MYTDKIAPGTKLALRVIQITVMHLTETRPPDKSAY